MLVDEVGESGDDLGSIRERARDNKAHHDGQTENVKTNKPRKRVRCDREDGCFCGERVIFRSGCTRIIPLICLLILFLLLFTLGLAVAFYITNTTFAILDGLSITGDIPQDSLVTIVDDTTLDLQVESVLWTYVPSLIFIWVYSASMTIYIDRISRPSASTSTKDLTATDQNNGYNNLSTAFGLGTDNVTSLMVSDTDTFTASPLRTILLTEHKRMLMEHAEMEASSIERLTDLELQSLIPTHHLESARGISNRRTTLRHFAYPGGRVVSSGNGASMTWPTTSKNKIRGTSADERITIRGKSRDPTYLSVSWNSWYGSRSHELEISAVQAAKILKSGSLLDGRQPPSKIRELAQVWTPGDRISGREPGSDPVLGREFVSFSNRTKARRQRRKKGGVVARVLQSRRDQPRNVVLRVGSAKGRQLSWWASSILHTLISACAHEARQASAILRSLDSLANLEFGESCGEQWLTELSLIQPKISRSRGLKAADEITQLQWEIPRSAFEEFGDPFRNVTYLRRGLRQLGSVKLKGQFSDAAMISSISEDCTTWGYINLVIEFNNVSACVWCTRVMKSHSFSHSIFVPCLKNAG